MLLNHRQKSHRSCRSSGHDRPMPSAGALLCLASAAAFGAMGIFGKLAYDEGATRRHAAGRPLRRSPRALLGARRLATGAAGELRALARRDVALALALGAVGYSAQAGCYFAALQRLDASLLSLLLYTFPAMVTVAAIALGRERASRRTAVALALASAGLVLVLAGAARRARSIRSGRRSASTAARHLQRLHPHLGRRRRRASARSSLSTLVCTGAAATLTLGGARRRRSRTRARVSAEGYGWLAAHRRRLHGRRPSASSSPACGASARRPRRSSRPLEPVSRSCSRSPSFGESLGPMQLAGGALVLAARWCVRRAPAARRARAARRMRA